MVSLPQSRTPSRGSGVPLYVAKTQPNAGGQNDVRCTSLVWAIVVHEIIDVARIKLCFVTV